MEKLAQTTPGLLNSLPQSSGFRGSEPTLLPGGATILSTIVLPMFC